MGVLKVAKRSSYDCPMIWRRKGQRTQLGAPGGLLFIPSPKGGKNNARKAFFLMMMILNSKSPRLLPKRSPLQLRRLAKARLNVLARQPVSLEVELNLVPAPGSNALEIR